MAVVMWRYASNDDRADEGHDAEKCGQTRPKREKLFWKRPRTCENREQSMIKLTINYVAFYKVLILLCCHRCVILPLLWFPDMQQLKLSRSDNPYIQKKLASRDEINMIDIDETADDDTNLIPSLMSHDSENDGEFEIDCWIQ